MNVIENIGVYFVPGILTLTGILLLCSKQDLFSAFVDGAKEGLKTAVGLIPVLVILMTALGMFSKSGAMSTLCDLIVPVTSKIGLPSEIVPLVLVRPLSGSAANATVNELFVRNGADSFAGRCASIMMGASDTIIYTLALYFGAAGIKKTRHAYPAAFLTMMFCTIMSVVITILFFGK